MLTEKDIEKLVSVLATKEEVKDLKEDIAGLREQVQALTLALDKLIKAINNLSTEYAAITLKLKRHEEWIVKLAKHSGLNLDDKELL